jgi:beta-N-acetylhexosaminidase
VRTLAATTAQRMPAPGIQRAATPATLPDATVAGAFRLDGQAHAWLAASGPVALVQVDSTANLAVGGVSWGPAALGATVTEAEVPAGARVAVVGRAVGAGHPASAVVDRLRGAGHDVVLVECGWPRGGADIETFGGSPAVARALVGLLRGEVGP